MYSLLLVLIFAILAIVLYIVYHVTDEDSYLYIGNVLTGCGVAVFLTLLIVNVAVYTSIQGTQANLTVIDRKIAINEERAKNTVDQLKMEAQKYVNYEESLFKDIKPENANILFNAYPNLRTIEAVRYLMEQITEMNNLTYNMKLSKEDEKAFLIKANTNKFVIFSSDYDLSK